MLGQKLQVYSRIIKGNNESRKNITNKIYRGSIDETEIKIFYT